ncbi:hypothetical protein C7446_1504 [Kushneria sinocarnis]|uniref:Uncharacterized protein n=1 Tax=Kushneria sinocarnis TaxID=595502 RepID=A0A420WX29_9GAMM|nr:hypothetical protein [Kushneria sinocarnis]RKR04299.1 hypothetical protein C7446_1504 [Kushneria sinocarnis]
MTNGQEAAGYVISVERRDGFNLRLTRVLRESTAHQLDIYLFVPGELGLDSRYMPEESFYHQAFHVRRMYHSSRYRLPRNREDPAVEQERGGRQYRVRLSLYAWQYAVALEHAVQQLVENADDISDARLDELAGQCRDVLGRLRQLVPERDKHRRYHNSIDNYLSWLTEQQLLRLVSHLPENEALAAPRERLLDLCREESAHRERQQYNSARVTADPSRIANKMRRLRRLIEYPIMLRQSTRELGAHQGRMVRALAAGLIMLVMATLLILARHAMDNLTLQFVLVLALLYAMREVFKEDLRHTLLRWLRKGRPRWRRRYFDVESGETVGSQLEWLDYTRYRQLDEVIQAARKGSLSQREEVILHYRSRSRMSPGRFLRGYEKIRETMLLDLQSLSRLMERETDQVYRLKKDEVVRDEVEKRHQLNLVIRTLENEQVSIQRWKITMNRSEIVDIEEVTVPEELYRAGEASPAS